MKKTISAVVVRTQVIGAGAAYDVYVPCRVKGYRPIAFGCYATKIGWEGQYYYRVDDLLRTPEIDGLPAFSDERWNAFKSLRRTADRLALRLAKRAFSELTPLSKLPTLWASWKAPNAQQEVPFTIDERYLA